MTGLLAAVTPTIDTHRPRRVRAWIAALILALPLSGSAWALSEFTHDS